MKLHKLFFTIFIILFATAHLYSQQEVVKYFEKGKKYFEEGKFSKSIKIFSKAIKLAPNQSKLYCERGRAFSEYGDTISAINDFDKSIKLDASYDNGNAYFCKGKIQFHAKNNYDSAIYYYEKAILYNNCTAYNNYGSILDKTEEYEKACSDLEKAKELNNYSAEQLFIKRCK